MIRLFNHYFHAWTLRRIFFDFVLSLLALAGVVLVQAENLGSAMPMAGAQVFSLAAMRKRYCWTRRNIMARPCYAAGLDYGCHTNWLMNCRTCSGRSGRIARCPTGRTGTCNSWPLYCNPGQ